MVDFRMNERSSNGAGCSLINGITNTVTIVEPREHKSAHELNRDISPKEFADRPETAQMIKIRLTSS